MLWTHLIKVVVIVVGTACLVIAYNLSPHLTRNFGWIPKTRKGQILLVFALWGAICLYVIFVDLAPFIR